MATLEDRVPDNVPGKYYVDDTCSFCNVCLEEAPDNMKENEDGDHCIVFKQPENDEEVAAMEAAIEGCPTESIGSDGE